MHLFSEAEAAKMILNIINISFLVIILAVSCLVFLRGRKSAFLFYYLASSFSSGFWLAALVLKLNAPGPITLWLLVCLQFSAFLCAAYFLLLSGISCYTGKPVPFRTALLLSLPGIISAALIMTNPLHEAFLVLADGLNQQAGLLYLYILNLNYTFLIAGLILGCVHIIRSINNRRFSHYLFVTGSLLPALLSAISAGSRIRYTTYLAPSLLAISLLIFGIFAVQNHFLDVTRLASHIILNEIGSALIITQTDGRIIDYNHTLSNIFSQTSPIELHMPVSRLDPQLQPEVKGKEAARQELWLETNQGNRLFEFSVHPVISRRQKKSGYVLRLLPLDQEQESRQILARQNEQMSIANSELQRYVEISSELRSIMVRNRLAREMHDSLGHTLIILLSVLERIRKAATDEIEYEALIKQSKKLMQQARNQLPQAEGSPPGARKPAFDPAAQNLKNEIGKLSQDLSQGGVRLEQDLRGDISLIPPSHYPELIQICREAITNAIKHGEASTISLFILVDEKQYELIILDNGQSDTEYQIGFGLHNMQQRAESLGGQIRTQGDSSGFGVYLSVPLINPTAQDDA